jgi:phosphate starvation-inducible protein PhoH
MGENSICIVNGDVEQSDLDEQNGLKHALSIFQDRDAVGIVRLSEKDVQRSKLVKIVIDAYNKVQE